jgi:hypothetical protein
MSNQTQQSILSFLKERNYSLITPINNIKINSDVFEYTCSCGSKRTRCLRDILSNSSEFKNKDYVPKCCIKIIPLDDSRYKWYLDENISEYLEGEEQWKRFQQYWVSSKGKVIGKKGNNLVENGRIKTGRKTYSLIELMATVFKPDELKTENIAYFENDIIDSNNIKFKDNYLSSFINKINAEELTSKVYKILTEFSDYKVYENGIIIRCASGKVKKDKIPTHEKHNNRLCIKLKDGNRYFVDILIIMAFSPFFEVEENYNKYLEEVEIIHIDGDYSNCDIKNLISKYKDQSKETLRKEREENRIAELRKYLKDYLIKVSGELITEFDNIKSIYSEVEYKCKCDTVFKRTIKHIKDNDDSNQCSVCRSKIINSSNSSNDDTLKIKGILYKKFEYGWISEKGEFINNNKEIITIKKDGMVKLAGKYENAKHIISRVYKIPHYEFLEEEGYFVKTKDKTNNISPDNLYIWGNGSKETIHLPLSKEFDDKVKTIESVGNKQSYFILDSPPDFEYKTSSLFPGIMIYKNGVFRLSKNTYTIGRIKTSGYCDIIIKNKTYSVHRIVCFLFNPIEGKTNLEDYKDLDVNHKNGIKFHNNADNLEWVTKSENIKHAIENELTGYTYPVNQYDIKEDGSKGNFIKKYPCIKYAVKETGQSYSYILSMCQGKSKPYKYIWEFVNREHIEKSQTVKRVKLTVDKTKITIED